MRSRRTEEQGEEEDINLTPMLDIVFIMLIFFIVTATFIREPGVDVLKPDAQKDARIPGVAVLVAVTEDNEIYIDGDQVEVHEVRPEVERLRTENPKGPVVIQADEEADTGVVVQVMNQVNATGARVSVSTKED
ncbi:MAG: ExbD/TolR family protein [Alphaproteobacteria bacterium]